MMFFGKCPQILKSADRQTDKHTDRQTNRQTDRQTDRQTGVHLLFCVGDSSLSNNAL